MRYGYDMEDNDEKLVAVYSCQPGLENHEKLGQLINDWDLYHNFMHTYTMATEWWGGGVNCSQH
jgi:hypothetical protein